VPPSPAGAPARGAAGLTGSGALPARPELKWGVWRAGLSMEEVQGNSAAVCGDCAGVCRVVRGVAAVSGAVCPRRLGVNPLLQGEEEACPMAKFDIDVMARILLALLQGPMAGRHSS